MLYFSVSLFTAQILYVYFCIDRFRIWIIDDKSFNVANVPFFKNITVLYGYRSLKLTMLNVLDSS